MKWLAKMIIAKYQPEIIGITGSVGKTGTKEAAYCVLKGKYRVRRSRKNYNNEIGVPLTVIDADSPGRHIFGWLAVFVKAAKLILIKDKNYPVLLILEMGVDRPGDMDYLNSIVRCDIGVLTFIGTVHAEYFASRSALREEKSKLIGALKPQGWAVINYDNEGSRQTIPASKSRVLTYGLDENAQVRAQEIRFSFDDQGAGKKIAGINFKLSYRGAAVPVHLPDVLGEGAVYSALAAAAIGLVKNMNLIEISRALEGYASPKGRMKVIPGIKRTVLIDDSYNSEPASLRAALGILSRIPLNSGARKLAALGDMLELGQYSKSAHADMGKYLVKCGVGKLYLVGERALAIGHGAEAAGMSRDDIFHFNDSAEAGRFIQDRIRPGDILLAKGSQGMRMEKIVRELMADPLRAKELLVRQDGEWEGR